MSKFAHDRAVAQDNGDVVPSLVRVRHWNGEGGRWRGYYTGRYDFRPIGPGPFGDGEAFACRPDEITDDADEPEA